MACFNTLLLLSIQGLGIPAQIRAGYIHISNLCFFCVCVFVGVGGVGVCVCVFCFVLFCFL